MTIPALSPRGRGLLLTGAGVSEDAHFASPLGTRQRLIAGILGIGIGFGGPFLLSVALVATSGDPSFLILPLPFLGGLWMIQGLAPSGVRLEADGVRLERRWLGRLVPYRVIARGHREPRRIGGLGAVGLNGLFGSYGWRWNPWTGWHYLAITNTRDLVYLETAAGRDRDLPVRARPLRRPAPVRLARLAPSPRSLPTRGMVPPV